MLVARVVKAFNTLYARSVAAQNPRRTDGRLVVFLVGDDAGVNATVSAFAGSPPVDLGGLRTGRLMQVGGGPLSGLERGEQAAERVVQRRGVLAALDDIHQLEEGRVLRRDADVRSRGRSQPRLVIVSGGPDRRAQLAAQAQESGFGEDVQQRLAAGEVVARRGVTDSRPARARRMSPVRTAASISSGNTHTEK